MVRTLTRLAASRGKPRTIKSDNGSEFISKAMDRWAYENGIELDFSTPRQADRQRPGRVLQWPLSQRVSERALVLVA